MKKILTLSAIALLAVGVAHAEVAPTEKTQLQQKLDKKNRPEGGSGGQSLIDGSGLEFFINTDVTFTTSESASGSASEASYTTAVVASTSLGGTTVTTLTDAFDGYNGVEVNGTSYNENGQAAFDPACLGDIADSRQLIFNPQVIGNLTVTRRVFVPDDAEFIRFVTSVTNNGGATENVTLDVFNNLGSDSDTVVTGSSNGDNVSDLTDTWVSTFEDYSGGTSGDPRLGHVVRGEGDTTLTAIDISDGTNSPSWSYAFDVPAGETRAILNFVTGQPNIPDSQAVAAQLAALAPPQALECLDAAQVASIINFEGGMAPPVIEVPTLADAGRVAFGLLLALSAFALLRRRF